MRRPISQVPPVARSGRATLSKVLLGGQWRLTRPTSSQPHDDPRGIVASTLSIIWAAGTFRMRQIRSSISTVGDCRFRSNWLTYSREMRAFAATCSCVSPARFRAFLSSSPSIRRTVPTARNAVCKL